MPRARELWIADREHPTVNPVQSTGRYPIPNGTCRQPEGAKLRESYHAVLSPGQLCEGRLAGRLPTKRQIIRRNVGSLLHAARIAVPL
jgi:hypothetical protein